MALRRAIPLALALVLATPVTSFATASTPPALPDYISSQSLPDSENDAASAIDLLGSAEINQQVHSLALANDRVNTEVIGHSVQGRDLLLVTVSRPQTSNDLPTVLFTANIHGDEWEGSDASLQLINDLATTQDPDELSWLSNNQVAFIVTGNPDGRHNNTRENAAGVDLNRDLLTASQPETQALRDVIIELNPLVLVDLHGYVNGTLIEPTTPPHGENTEFDLLVENAYPLGLQIESDLKALSLDDSDDVRDPQVPLRDWSDGWDGWPPVFLPQYAALHGTVGLTIELPLRTNNSAYDLDQGELDRRSATNIQIADQAMRSTLDYAVTAGPSLTANQQEIFERGQSGAQQQPATELGLDVVGAEDVYQTEFPAAYVIPAGSHQRSEPAAARLVDALLANDVVVRQSTRGFTVAGTAYPAGSYVVPGGQDKRGVAGAMLGPGTDISARVPLMYDIAAWSMADLWGANVVRVDDAASVPELTEPVQAAEATGGVTGTGPWLLELNDPNNVAAMNALLEAEVDLGWTAQGEVLIPLDGANVATEVARSYGVELVTASADNRAQAETEALSEQIQIAASAAPEEIIALEQMGFAVTEFSSQELNSGFAWDEIDVAYVSDELSWRSLGSDAQNDFTDFLADGGGLVAQGEVGADLNQEIDGLELSAEVGPATANGIVDVTSSVGPIASQATPQTYVYGPVWFTDLGTEVSVDQRLAADPLSSGHWPAGSAAAPGPGEAGGQALVVHGVDTSGATSGAPITLIGSDPLFRAHPQGQFPLVGAAIAWSVLDSTGRVTR